MSTEGQREKSQREVSPATKVETAPTPKNFAVDTTEAGALSKMQSPGEEPEWQQSAQATLNLLFNELPEVVKVFVNEYKQPLTIAGIVLASVPVLALAAAILDVINSIPLFAATFELIGFGFTGWFAYRYLLYADRRQDFYSEVEVFKQQIFGNKNDTES
jgi:hypothetical protein